MAPNGFGRALDPKPTCQLLPAWRRGIPFRDFTGTAHQGSLSSYSTAALFCAIGPFLRMGEGTSVNMLQLAGWLFGMKIGRPQPLPRRVRLFLEDLEERALPSTFYWHGPTGDTPGNWSDYHNWVDSSGDSVTTPPGTSDYALFSPGVGTNGNCIVDGNFTVDRVEMGSGYTGTVFIGTGNALGATTQFIQNGTMNLIGGTVTCDDHFYVEGTVNAQPDDSGNPSILTGSRYLSIAQSGTINVTGSSAEAIIGMVITSDLFNDGGPINIGTTTDYGELKVVSDSFTVDPTNTVTIIGHNVFYSRLIFASQGDVNTFTVQGEIDMFQGRITTDTTLTLDSGTIVVDHNDTVGPADIIDGDVNNSSGGTITWQGSSMVRLYITGNYSQGDTTALQGLHLRVSSFGNDDLFIGGTATLAGSLTVTLAGAPASGPWDIITAAGGISGDFAQDYLPPEYSYNLTATTVQIM
jgi:hypothetical protein